MRLLHTKELRFKEFSDRETPRYAILSHRWGSDEVSYQDMLAKRNVHGDGYQKIVACCHYVAADQNPLCYKHETFEWIWIDTCCIDKSSSAELSEAINSMSRWYHKAAICYAYLSDVEEAADEYYSTPSFMRSNWFTRGWTLQELLAPTNVVFLDKNWKPLGTKSALAPYVTKVTGINERTLRGQSPWSIIGSSTVAQAMSWAAERKTIRREDQAYCLWGLFDINMALLYGEGDKAFRRLQEEIIRSSNDESIFVWNRANATDLSFGILARSPSDFSYWRRGQDKGVYRITDISRPPYSITNQGLGLRVPKRLSQQREFLFPLSVRCATESGQEGAIAIYLERSTLFTGAWRRLFSSKWRDYLPRLSEEVRCLEGSNGLFVVPLSWVWSREELARSESEIIYVVL